jgi:hypothetical protein
MQEKMNYHWKIINYKIVKISATVRTVQGSQIGQIFAYWAIYFLWQFI